MSHSTVTKKHFLEQSSPKTTKEVI